MKNWQERIPSDFRATLKRLDRGAILWLSWFIFICVFLSAGVIGHDPWKQDETYSFGIIYHFYTTHTWLVPTNAGNPFMEKPPIYYWTAIFFIKLFRGILSLPDAARLASVFYTVLTGIFTWKTANVLLQKQFPAQPVAWISLSLLLGTLGYVKHSHDMFTDTALIAGSSLAMYGLALMLTQEKPEKKTSIFLGVGIGLGFLAKGVLPVVLLVLCISVILILLPKIRRDAILRVLFIAAIVVSPFLIIWPSLLYIESHELFMRWFWDNNVGRFLGFSVGHLGAANKPFFILYSALWFAFPTFPLALVMIFCVKNSWRSPRILLPAVIAIIGLIILLCAASGRSLYLLLLLPAFTVLATQGLMRLSTIFLLYWNRFVSVLYLCIIAMMWLLWWSLITHHWFKFVPLILRREFPNNFIPSNSQYFAVMIAAMSCAFYIYNVLVIMKDRRSSIIKDTYLRIDTANLWFCGVATVWILSNSLLLPWIDLTKSYRSVLGQLEQTVEKSVYKNECINTYRLGESIGPMWQYINKNHTLNEVASLDSTRCPLLFTVTQKTASAKIAINWSLMWKGSRACDAKNEELRLYYRGDDSQSD